MALKAATAVGETWQTEERLRFHIPPPRGGRKGNSCGDGRGGGGGVPRAPREPRDLHFSILKKEETVCEAGAEPQTVVREGSGQKGSNSEAAEGGLGAGCWGRRQEARGPVVLYTPL